MLTEFTSVNVTIGIGALVWEEDHGDVGNIELGGEAPLTAYSAILSRCWGILFQRNRQITHHRDILL